MVLPKGSRSWATTYGRRITVSGRHSGEGDHGPVEISVRGAQRAGASSSRVDGPVMDCAQQAAMAMIDN